MDNLRIRTNNSRFSSQVDLELSATAEEALAIGVRGAVGIATDEVILGAACSSVIVTIESKAGHRILRSAVSLSVSPLCTD